MKVTIEPTESYFTAKDLMIRAWRGTDETGGEVVAFVAAIATTSDAANLEMVPIPPPLEEASEETRFALAAVWDCLKRLDDEKAIQLLRGWMVLAETMLDCRPGFHAIVAGWLLKDDFFALTNRIERLANWTERHLPLTDDEQAIVTMMIGRQIALGPSLLSDPDDGDDR